MSRKLCILILIIFCFQLLKCVEEDNSSDQDVTQSDEEQDTIDSSQSSCKKEIKFRTLRPMSSIKYRTLLRLVQGSFNVKTHERTREQNNAVTQFYRSRGLFEIRQNKLLYNGIEVVQTDEVKKLVNNQFIKSHGCGARSLSQILRRKFHGVTERQVQKQYSTSKHYQQNYPKFTNRPPIKPIFAQRVNEKWQVDLIDMRKDEVVSDGKKYKYILSVVDVFSRFLILRSLSSKTALDVKIELEKVIAEHGRPKIIQCDQGNEFKGQTNKYLSSQSITVIRSRPYHPQSQGKCERSHQLVRKKISFQNARGGFNWVKGLHKIQQAINETPKEVLAGFTPFEVVRGSDDIISKVAEATRHCSQRDIKSKTGGREHTNSVYNINEHVFFRYPGKGRVPTRRHILKAKVIDRKIQKGLYKLKFRLPSGIIQVKWVDVEDIASLTLKREKKRRDNGRKYKHRSKFLIPLTEDDRMAAFDIFGDRSITVRFNPQGIGNCQFDSVANQLREYGIHRNGISLRREAVEHINNYLHAYENFVTGNVNDYCNNMQRESTYGDHLTLLAMAREYNVHFLIVSSRGIDHTTVVSNDGRLRNDRITLTLGHYPEHHYVSLDISPNTLATIQENIDVFDDIVSDYPNENIGSDDIQDSCMSESGDANMTTDSEENVAGDRNETVDTDESVDGYRDGSVDTDECVDGYRDGSVDTGESVDGYRDGSVDRGESVDGYRNGSVDRGESVDGYRDGSVDRDESVDGYRDGSVDRDVDGYRDGSVDRGESVAGDMNESADRDESGDSYRDGSVDRDVDGYRDGSVDRGESVAGDRNESADRDESVAGDYDRSFDGGESVDGYRMDKSGNGYRDESVDGYRDGSSDGFGNQSVDRDECVDGDRNESVDGKMSESMDCDRDENVERDSQRFEEDDVSQQDHIPRLPREIWENILKLSLQNDPSSRYSIMYVSRMFHDIISRTPLPEIYIPFNVMSAVPRLCSVRRLHSVAGRHSGVIMEIKNIIPNSRWINAWLHLREIENRWFQITFIWWRRR